MSISVKTQATLLLTAHFSKAGSDGVKPLTAREWSRFAEWLKYKSLDPERLLAGNLNALLTGWHDKTAPIQRITALLDRGPALALSMEKWLRSGLWVMTRSDPDYPAGLKQRLNCDSPAVLFGCGRRSLLGNGGLAVIGSRNAHSRDLEYSQRLGALASDAGISIISGGARGVDETSMLGALEAEGTAVGVLADSLLKACSSVKYRRHLVNSNLVLVSPFNPESGFNTGNAMQRNKYIYCLSDVALAVHSGKKGGTWTGARENLSKNWVPLWVKRTEDPEAGNDTLISLGASEAPSNLEHVSIKLFFPQATDPQKILQNTSKHLLTASEQASLLDETKADPDVKISSPVECNTEQATGEVCRESHADKDVVYDAIQKVELLQTTLYDVFIVKAQELCKDEARSTDELVAALLVNKTQMNDWLKQAVADGKLKKITRPVRYETVNGKQESLPL